MTDSKTSDPEFEIPPDAIENYVAEMRDRIRTFLASNSVPPEAKEGFLSSPEIALFLDEYGLED